MTLNYLYIVVLLKNNTLSSFEHNTVVISLLKQMKKMCITWTLLSSHT